MPISINSNETKTKSNEMEQQVVKRTLINANINKKCRNGAKSAETEQKVTKRNKK